MKPYYERESIVIYNGDCRRVMQRLPRDSADAIVTDPPYGLGFMGRAWDHDVPGRIFWTLMGDMLKPGGHLLSFGGTRTFHRIAVNIVASAELGFPCVLIEQEEAYCEIAARRIDHALDARRR